MSRNPLDAHWKSFKALQNDYTNRSVVLGVDRGFAQRWVLLGGEGCPVVGQLVEVLLAFLLLLFLAGTVVSLMYQQYVLAGLIALAAVVDWRLFGNLAVSFARNSAITDERLFRTWFRERRISILKKSTGEYVWYNLPDEA